MLSNNIQWDSFATLDQILTDSPSASVEMVNTTPANWNEFAAKGPATTWNPRTSISAQFSAQRAQRAQRAQLATYNRVQKPHTKSRAVASATITPESYTKIIHSVGKNSKSPRTPRSVAPQTLQEFLDSLRSRHAANQHHTKPPYPYATMILLALLQNDRNRLTLSQIYKWMTVHFPFFQMSQATWQNSIRHNLSLNKAFAKTEKSPDRKSYFWEFQRGCEKKFFRNLDISFDELKLVVMNIDQYFNIAPSITIEPVAQQQQQHQKKTAERREQQLPTPPTTNDHSLNVGLAPAFEISTRSSLKVPALNGQHVGATALPKSDSTCSIEEGLDALKTPEFKNYESMAYSPLTPNKLASIHSSNLAFFQIWNESHSF